MLSLNVRVGEAVQIGDAACIVFDNMTRDRGGAKVVKMRIASALSPILIIATGIIPRQFTTGITGERRPIERQAAIPIRPRFPEVAVG